MSARRGPEERQQLDEIIDLCSSSPPERKQRGGSKRRRDHDDGAALPEPGAAVELSSGDEEEPRAWRRGRAGEKQRAKQARSDEALARRLQEEEHLNMLDGSSGLALPRELQQRLAAGSRFDWLGNHSSAPPFAPPPPGRAGGHGGHGGSYSGGGGSGLSHLLPLPGGLPLPPSAFGMPVMMAGMPMMAGLLGGLGGGSSFGSSRAGQLAHLSLMDRDFGEADYEMLLQLDELDEHEKRNTRRANGKLLEALPSKRLKKAEERGDAVCAICLEALKANQTVMTLRCKHEYHRACILKWLKGCETPSCPQCKLPALGGGGASPKGSPKRESSPEQQWWHT